MSIKPVQNQFNGGEISPYMDGRFDLPAYQYSAEALINNIPISEGCVKRRGGSHFVASAKQTEGIAFEIQPIPTDATVIINGIQQSICYCGYADEVEYTVMCEGYKTKSGRVTLVDDLTLPIRLVSTETFYTVNINPTPSDARVVINGLETTSFTKGRGAKINWSVSREGLISQSGSFILSGDTDMDITLLAKYTIVPDPADSTVIINGVETNSVEVLSGSTVEWSVSHPEFKTQSGIETINTSVIKSVSIVVYHDDQTLFETSVADNYSLRIYEDVVAEVTIVGGGGAAAIRGQYDDKGYGWSGGSGGAFIGTFNLPAGDYNIVVGKANNNTKGQGGNTNTLNPADMTKYGSMIEGVVEVGGGGSGHYSPSYVGEAGASATLHLIPLSIKLNSTGNVGVYGYGGKGSSWPPAHCNGGASVYEGYGQGQGCVTSEYAGARYWKNGTAGYVKIVIVGNS